MKPGHEKMNRFIAVAMIFCLALVALAFPPRVKADDWNKKTIVAFNHRVEIPGGKVLPAGRYVFELLDSASDRNIVQIFNEDQTHLYATILAIPNHRLRPTGKTVMTFRARASGSPKAIRAWFYPGANWGQEFVYPKKRAIRLAKLTHKPVPSMPSELASNITMLAKSMNDPPIMALKEAPLKAVKPNGEEVAIAVEITVLDRVPLGFGEHRGQGEARPEASLVANPSSSMKIHTIRLHKVRIVVAILGAVILTALFFFFFFVRARSAAGGAVLQRLSPRESPQPPGRVLPFGASPKKSAKERPSGKRRKSLMNSIQKAKIDELRTRLAAERGITTPLLVTENNDGSVIVLVNGSGHVTIGVRGGIDLPNVRSYPETGVYPNTAMGAAVHADELEGRCSNGYRIGRAPRTRGSGRNRRHVS